MTVRRSDELQEYFGSAEGANYPQASVAALSDVLTGVTYDIWIGPYGTCERTVMLKLVERLNPGDVLIMDRGYPSSEVIDALDRLDIDFVIRVPARGTWTQITEFAESSRQDDRLKLPLRKPVDKGDRPTMDVRVVKASRPGSDPMLLLTSLSQSEASIKQLDQLYHERWAIEETYKLGKGQYMNQGQLHSMSVEGVEQEILALHLFISLARTMRRLAANQTGADHRDFSQKSAIVATARYIAGLVLAPRLYPRQWLEAAKRVLSWIARRPDKRRPNRQFPRRSFQPRQRWNAQGRVGALS